MPTAGQHASATAPPQLRAAVENAGFSWVDADPDLLVAASPDAEPGPLVDAVLGGARLLLACGNGRLSTAMHLHSDEERVTGAAAGPEPLPDVTAEVVTGVGYALYRIDGRTVALDAPRGDGRVVFLGPEPDPSLVAACAKWVMRQNAPEPR